MGILAKDRKTLPGLSWTRRRRYSSYPNSPTGIANTGRRADGAKSSALTARSSPFWLVARPTARWRAPPLSREPSPLHPLY
ncbi:hypothetical protein P186_0652 [Pyrobaculum ferrireducens]|uniref:Uncharacterized protein n=1 Tax=Pyrobaculum ferrireducens TaxID=1104324 RepID=G7VHT1_9CREN|nr:hypothetical protein P186_0652 [Pyrobaculum ferrireducens]